MRLTLNIPDKIYRQLEKMAANEELAVKEIILRANQKEIEVPASADHPLSENQDQEKKDDSDLLPRQRLRFPIIKSTRPGSLVIDSEKIYEIIGFP